MSTAQNTSALHDAVAAWNEGDGEAYLTLYSEDVTHHGPAPEPFDAAANRAFYEATWAAFPESRLTIDDVVAAGDKVSARFHLEGKHQGEFMGIPATGRPFVLPGQTILRFAGGKVVERWTTSDLLGLMVQLGVVPPPGG